VATVDVKGLTDVEQWARDYGICICDLQGKRVTEGSDEVWA